MRLITPRGQRGWLAKRFYGCTRYPACKGTHGAHQETGHPLGVPANEATRRARMQAHDDFDLLWKTPGYLTRDAAYRWITEAMGRTEQVHIGSATIEECAQISALARRKCTQLFDEKAAVKLRRKKVGKYVESRKVSMQQRIRTAERLDRKHERRHHSDAPPKTEQEGKAVK